MTEQELIKRASAQLKKMKAFDKKAAIAEQKNQNELDNLVKLINKVFSNHGIHKTINKTQIRFNAEYIGNISRITDKKLSMVILDSIYPKPKRKIYSHYTKFDKGENIIANKHFWLFNLLQNFNADEFSLFYEEHDLDGYKRNRETFGLKTGYRPLMSEIFALCLTTKENKDPSLWNYFSDNGTGLKLTFEVKSHIPDFREVYYSDDKAPKQIPLLKELFTEVKDKFSYPLNFTYMSKIGAFYIRGDFKNEKEYRFLIKRSADDYNAWKLNPITFQKDISYIVLPFRSEYATFKLLNVEKGPNCDITKFNKIVPMIKRKHPHTNIVI